MSTHYFQKPLSPDLSPNVTKSDRNFALFTLLNPFSRLQWKFGGSIQQLEHTFKEYFQVGFARSFDSGRSALQAIIESLELSEGDEVITQAFTCTAVPNSIIAAGATPIYIDIDETYNLDPKALHAYFESGARVKAVIIQHTFGIPADIAAIAAVCKQYNCFLIEDCAHSLGATYKGQKIGTFGDAALFSFGRDKVISSVSGGMAITNNAAIGEGINRIWKGISFPTMGWIAQRLRHPIVLETAKTFYYTGSLGKVIIHLAKKMAMIPVAISQAEREGKQARMYRLPNILAQWAARQFAQLAEMNQHRRDIAAIYMDTESLSSFASQSLPANEDTVPIWLRYTIEVEDRAALIKQGKENGILFGIWYDSVVAPANASLEAVQYVPGSCPRAERLAQQAVNLPTTIQTTPEDAQHIAAFILKHINRDI